MLHNMEQYNIVRFFSVLDNTTYIIIHRSCVAVALPIHIRLHITPVWEEVVNSVELSLR